MITLKTLEKATAQQVFDQVAKHLIAQNKRSVLLKLGGCAYRGEGGTKCAAGCLIADDEYASNWEGSSWGDLVKAGCVPRNHEALIYELQYLHDLTVDDAPYWIKRLGKLAEKHKLNTDALTKS